MIKYLFLACSTEKEPVFVKPVVSKDEYGEYLSCPNCGSDELEEIEKEIKINQKEFIELFGKDEIEKIL